MIRNRRKAFIVSAALVGGAMLMTACGQGDDSAGAGKASNAVDATAAAKKAGAKGVSGTFAGGTVEYLAQGTYVVSAPGKQDQQFWIADDTKIYGAGTICGDAASKADAPCTEANLKAATKGGRSVEADVVMKDGAATQVMERRASAGSSGSAGTSGSGNGSGSGSGEASGSGETVVEGIDKGKGVNGTWYGIVKYMAPGKYEVSGASANGSGGEAQVFYLAEDTVILGGGEICGEAGSKVDAPCEEADLQASAKSGVEAEVVVRNGIATKITDGELL
ncbi:hypothetical protein GR925_16235 [Streptomyces sp. HUCO-GS316]|uniref:hypothetical protein n=1 Tax=Streptomyces sp. HUCO-GS316 TaxID=2692198 RepID=UPI001368C0A5|nr:hypothetical protein [Streptomyces sp. HUCO-GS316]MXM64944.1 hypothetical protein [Streptomyces sp. HUCO-GS316]